MPTYVYETIPTKEGETPTRYEIKQSIKESPLEKHPQTGESIHRIIAGAANVLTSSRVEHTHTSSCGCGAGGCRA
jgi:predicted nucleic acid-binding Zn ribbon protein